VALAATLDAALPTAPLIDAAWLHAVTTQTATIIHAARAHFAAVLRMASSFTVVTCIGLLDLTCCSGGRPDLAISLTRPDRRVIARER
jgi:hypothetical protein